MKLIEILFSNLSSLPSFPTIFHLFCLFILLSNRSSHRYSHHKSGRKLIYRETTNRSKGSKNRLKYIHLSHFLSKFKEQCSFSSEVAWLDNKLKHDTNSPKSTNPSESASNVENILFGINQDTLVYEYLVKPVQQEGICKLNCILKSTKMFRPPLHIYTLISHLLSILKSWYEIEDDAFFSSSDG